MTKSLLLRAVGRRARAILHRLRSVTFEKFAELGVIPVHQFLRALTGRLAADSPARLMSSGRYCIAITHGYGGGSELSLADRLREIAAEKRLIPMTAAPAGVWVKLVVHERDTRNSALVSRRWFLRQLRLEPPSTVILNGLHGWTSLTPILATLHALPSTVSLEVPVHDYLAICPSFFLRNRLGDYCGVPALSECETCYPSVAGELRREFHDVSAWRTGWWSVVRRADKVLVFSEDSARLLRRAFPEVTVSVSPHKLPSGMGVPRHIVPPSDTDRIGVFGYIGPEKGAEVLVETAALAAAQGHRLEWHIFGLLSASKIHESIVVHGAYDRADMPQLAERFGIVAAAFPSIVPETFSFVAEELAHMQIPFAAFPLGAPFERLRSNSLVVFASDMSAASLLGATLQAVDLGRIRFGGQPAEAMFIADASRGSGSPAE